MATLPYWNNDEVISSDKLNSMVKAIIDGDPLAIKVSNATKNDVNQIVSYLSSLHNKAKTNLNSATSTSAFDTAYTDMKSLVSNKLGSYANDDTVDLYSTGIRASIITFLQAYDTMMSNDRLNNKNTDNTLNGRIDSEAQTRSDDDNAINTKISDMQANGGGRNLARGTSSDWVDLTGFDNNVNYSVFPANIYLDTLQIGDTMTWGITLKNTGITSGSFVLQGYGDVTGWNKGALDGKSYNISNDLPVGTTKTFVLTTVISSDQKKNDYFSIQLRTDNIPKGGTLSYRCIFAEKGTIVHDWSPAPEDVDSDIKSVNAKADANTASISKITSNGGGRNLLTGTSDNWITKTATSWMNVTTANSNKTSVADYHNGDKFTYSAIVTNKSNTNVRLEMWCCDKNGTRMNGDSNYASSDFVAPNTTAKRISCTITIDSNTWYVEHTLIADGGTSTSKTVQIRCEMFEVGTVAHDWSPNPDEVQSQLDNLNANKLSSADANWNLVAKNSSNTYNYASGSKITLPNGSSITIYDDRIVPHINLPKYLADYTSNTDFNVIATSCGECDNLFIPSAIMATLSNCPTNPDTNDSLTGDCFYTYHYAYSGTTVRAFQKIYSCDYNYVFIRSYNSSSQSWTNWSCLTPYA